MIETRADRMRTNTLRLQQDGVSDDEGAANDIDEFGLDAVDDRLAYYRRRSQESLRQLERQEIIERILRRLPKPSRLVP